MPYESFATKDGGILLGGGNDRLYGILCERIGEPGWAKEDRFFTNELRVKHRKTLVGMIVEKTKHKTTQVGSQPLDHRRRDVDGRQEWLDIFEGSGMPYAPVNDIQATLSHEHIVARGMVKTVHHPTCGPIRLVNTPVKFSESTPGIRTAPPTLGQHTDEVLQEVIGMGVQEIEDLKAAGVIS